VGLGGFGGLGNIYIGVFVKRFMKKGQVTVFIIVGLLIVGIVGGVGYSIKVNKDAKLSEEFFSSIEIKPQINNLQSSVFNCMDQVSKDGLEEIGIQGGFYEKPKKFFDLEWAFIPYYYYEGDFFMPSKKTIESELSKYVNDNLKICLDEIDSGDFEMNYKTAKTKTFIREKEVGFNIDLGVGIEKEGNKITLELEEFPVVVDSALSSILEVAEYYTYTHKEDPKMVCISCLGEVAEERDLYVDAINFDANTILVVISENMTASEPYAFEFLNKYTGDEISPKDEVGDSLGVPVAPNKE